MRLRIAFNTPDGEHKEFAAACKILDYRLK
jgi:hypothetical protein